MLANVSSPGGSVTWIAGKDGAVQRRDADGATRMQHSGVSTDLIAGSAPSATVCWIVGRSGTIIRTTDGEHWELITAPTVENLDCGVSQQREGRNDHDRRRTEFCDLRRRR